jgi:hypothetical protein
MSIANREDAKIAKENHSKSSRSSILGGKNASLQGFTNTLFRPGKGRHPMILRVMPKA